MRDLPEGWVETEFGILPKAWEPVEAQQFCKKVADGTHDSPKQQETGKLLITSKNIKDSRLDIASAYHISTNDFDEVNKRSKVDQWDVLLSMIGTVGEVCLIDEEPDFAIKNVGLFKCGDETKGKWLYYFLKSKSGQHYIYSRLSGTTQKYITLGELRKFPIPNPPLPEQKAIADMLSSFDEKIELLREQNKTLETLAQTIFKEWFVNFKGGEAIPISELIEFNPIERIDRKKEYLFFDMKALSINSMATAEGIFKKSNSGTSFRESDTLFAKITPCLENGKTAFVLDLKGEAVARGSTEFIVMRAKENGSPYLNYCICRDENFRDYAVQSMTGTSGRQRVPVDRLKTYEIQYSQENISKFNNAANPCFEKIKNNAAQIQSLSKTRDTLLPKLMNGKVRVM